MSDSQEAVNFIFPVGSAIAGSGIVEKLHHIYDF
jgi:hypothetical protein